MKEICKECTRKCQQAICCICEYYNICECSKIEPSKVGGTDE